MKAVEEGQSDLRTAMIPLSNVVEAEPLMEKETIDVYRRL